MGIDSSILAWALRRGFLDACAAAIGGSIRSPHRHGSPDFRTGAPRERGVVPAAPMVKMCARNVSSCRRDLSCHQWTRRACGRGQGVRVRLEGRQNPVRDGGRGDEARIFGPVIAQRRPSSGGEDARKTDRSSHFRCLLLRLNESIRRPEDWQISFSELN